MLVVIGLAIFWGGLFGIVDALFIRQVQYATSTITILQAAASGLMMAVLCLPICLAAFGVASLALRLRPRDAAADPSVRMVVQATAMFVPLATIAIAWLHHRLPETIPVASTRGLALSTALLLGSFGLSLGLSRVVKWAVSGSWGALAVGGFGLLFGTGLAVSLGSVNAHRPPSGGVNLLIISIDSLRQDTFAEYVEEHASPIFRRFVAAGRRYQNAHTTFTHSLAAHASMFTGLYPHEHGAMTFREANRSFVGSPISREVGTLAEVLGANGYETMAVLTNPWLGVPFGLERGFQTHVNDATVRALGSFELRLAVTASVFGPYLRYVNQFVVSASHINSELFLGWLRSRDRSRPFFAFLHYLDMHPPNIVERRYAERFCRGPYAKLDGRQLQTAVRNGEFAESEMPAVRSHVRNLYMAALARMDDQLSPVLEELMDKGWLDDTLVALVSDHGENLYEKVNSYEKEHVYEASARVPFVLRVPGEAEGSEQDSLVSLVDIAATFFGRSGVRPNGRIQGVDLVSGPSRRAEDGDWISVTGMDGTQQGHARAVLFADGHKYIRDASGREALYDLRNDPRELHDLSGGSTVASYRSRFALIVEGMADGRDRVLGREAIPSETIERLKALGYVH